MTATLPLPARAVAPVRGSSRRVRRIVTGVLVGVFLLVQIYPLFWLVMGSFKTQTEFFGQPTWSLPSSFEFTNYVEAWTTGNLGRNFLNSILVTAPSLFLMITLGVAAAFALEVMVWRGRNAVLLLFVAGIMIPGQMILVPLFISYFQLNLTGTLWPLIITYTVMGLPLTVFLMAAYFRSIPREVFEAATIDGAGMIKSFFLLGVPLMRNAIITIALVEFLSVWNDLLIALTFTTRSELSTIQVGLLRFNDEYGSTQYGPLFAAISINLFAMLALFLFLNRQIMAGLAAGATKG